MIQIGSDTSFSNFKPSPYIVYTMYYIVHYTIIITYVENAHSQSPQSHPMSSRDRRRHDGMLVGFTTAYAISAHHHQVC